jgi:hypothetical protein
MLTLHKVTEVLKNLPEEGQTELASYLEYLRFKYQVKPARTQHAKKVRLKDLKGILKGYNFSSEVIAQARQEMWGTLGHEPRLKNKPQ